MQQIVGQFVDVALKYDSGSTLAYIFTLEPFKQLILNGEFIKNTP